MGAARGSKAAVAAGRDPGNPCRRYVALVAGRLPPGDKCGHHGPLFRCEEPLRQLNNSAHRGQTDGDQQPSQALESKGKRMRPPKLQAITDFETLAIFDDDVVAGSASLIVATPRTGVADQVQ